MKLEEGEKEEEEEEEEWRRGRICVHDDYSSGEP
jgi:hypothetical protein